jgi:hypothetical protein
VELGMTKDEVAELMQGRTYNYGKTISKFPKKIEIIEEDYNYEDFGFLYLRYLENKLVYMVVHLGNELLFENIDVLKNDYERTITELQNDGHDMTKDIGSGYRFDGLGLGLAFLSGEFKAVNIYDDVYYKNQLLNYEKYNLKMGRDKDNNVVIRYTNIPATSRTIVDNPPKTSRFRELLRGAKKLMRGG